MVKAPIPERLNRNGIKQSFPRVPEATWCSFFKNEKNNGLCELRVIGPDKYAFYDVQELMSWLMERNLYRRSDFNQPGELLYDSPLPHVTTHLLAS